MLTTTFPFKFSISLTRSFFFIALISSNDSSRRFVVAFRHFDKPSPRRGVRDLARASAKKPRLYSTDVCGIKNEIKTMSGGGKNNCRKNYMKIKFNSNDDLHLINY